MISHLRAALQVVIPSTFSVKTRDPDQNHSARSHWSDDRAAGLGADPRISLSLPPSPSTAQDGDVSALSSSVSSLILSGSLTLCLSFPCGNFSFSATSPVASSHNLPVGIFVTSSGSLFLHSLH